MATEPGIPTVIVGPEPSMMFRRVAAETHRRRLAETRPGAERTTNWWVKQVLDAVDAEGFAVVSKWNIERIESALDGFVLAQTVEEA